jgi:hypothetical protein
VRYLLQPVPFILLMGALYVLLGRRRRRAEIIAFVLAVTAAIPLVEGGMLLVTEQARREHGQVMPGIVERKLSSTGEDGTRTIGGNRLSRRSWRSPWLKTADGFRAHDVLARVLLTGSRDAWVVEYRYPCGAPKGCARREFVSHALWRRLDPGQTVNVRSPKGQPAAGRLSENPQWNIALAKLGIGAALALCAAWLSGHLRLRRRTYLTAPAIVTAVDPVRAGGTPPWRVAFAYVSADGAARESADEVYVDGIRPGDTGTAVYPRDAPDLGSLRLAR